MNASHFEVKTFGLPREEEGRSEKSASLTGHSISKDVLQRELHDPRISRRGYLTEEVVIENRRRIHHSETICEIERFCPELDALAFANLQSSRQR
jgi:hypothetical protein